MVPLPLLALHAGTTTILARSAALLADAHGIFSLSVTAGACQRPDIYTHIYYIYIYIWNLKFIWDLKYMGYEIFIGIENRKKHEIHKKHGDA